MCIIGPTSHRGLLACWQDTEVPSFGLLKCKGRPLMLRNSRVGANSLVRPQWVIWAMPLAREKKQAFENSSNREQTEADTPWIGENHGELELKDFFCPPITGRGITILAIHRPIISHWTTATSPIRWDLPDFRVYRKKPTWLSSPDESSCICSSAGHAPSHSKRTHSSQVLSTVLDTCPLIKRWPNH